MLEYYLLWLVLCALLIWFLIGYRHHIRSWLTQHPTLSQKRRRRSVRCPFPTKRPDCPLCQADGHLNLPPEPPAMLPAKRGPKPTIDTRFHFCPNTHCPYYGWMDKRNITRQWIPKLREHTTTQVQGMSEFFLGICLQTEENAYHTG